MSKLAKNCCFLLKSNAAKGYFCQKSSGAKNGNQCSESYIFRFSGRTNDTMRSCSSLLDKKLDRFGSSCSAREAVLSLTGMVLTEHSSRKCVTVSACCLHAAHSPSGCRLTSCRYAFSRHLPSLSLVISVSLRRMAAVNLIFTETCGSST